MKKHANIQRRVKNAVKTAMNNYLPTLLNPVVEIVTESGLIPKYASESSAGADIFADLWKIQEKFLDNAEVVRREDNTIESIVVHPGGQCLVPTGLYTAFPGSVEAQIRPRSGNSLKSRIVVTNSPGTIEGDYKDEWGIIIANEGRKDFIIHQGDRIAQVVFSLVVRPRFVVKEKVSDLSGSNRGGGFGHTGLIKYGI